MKKFYLILMLLTVFGGSLQAQDSCGLYIRTDFDSECLLTTINPEGRLTHIDGSEDCWLACKGNTVNYTAVCDHVGAVSWVVSGADHFTTDSTGATVIVTWGDGDMGHLSASVNIGDSLTCTVDVCVFLIESPHIASTSVPGFYYDAFGFKHIEICQDELIELTDISSAGTTPITGCLWSSPYGNASSDHYSIRPGQTGEFSIAHSVQNECGCVDEEKIYVKVTGHTKLEISCHGTACAGTKATYTAEGPACTQYHWLVEGGAITQGQGTPTITVSWGEPSSGYGVVSLDASLCDTTCDALISVKVPVISDNVEITGPDTVCTGDYEMYGLPAWGATNYQWTLASTTGAYIWGGTDPNQCLVEFRNSGTYVIKVNYHCPFLDCGPFTATKKVFAMKRLEIESDVSTLCEGNEGVFTAGLSEDDPGTWCVYDSVNNLLYQAVRDSIHYTFNRPGVYRITVSNHIYCNTAEYSVTVLARPPALTNVTGPQEACFNSTIQLSATPTHPRYYLEWKPLCTDVSPSVHDGDNVSVQYGNTVCGVAVYQIDNEYGCPSEAYIHQVDTFRLLPLGIPDDTTICAGASVEYYASDQLPNVTYLWTVEPANAASVLDDHMLPHVGIRTNHLYNAQTPYLVDVTVKRTYCSILERYDHVTIHVVDVTPPQLVCPDTLCTGYSGQFSAIGGTAGSLYRWEFSDTEITFPYPTVLRAFDTAGIIHYSLTYFPADGCDSVVLNSSVLVLPTPSSHIVYHNSELSVPDQQGVSYLWLYNGYTLPNETSASITVGNYGLYCCSVTSLTSPFCSSYFCYEYQPSMPDTCEIRPLSLLHAECNTAVVKVNNPAIGPFEWVSSPTGTDISPSSTTDTASFVFNVPGIHHITALAEHDGQCYRDTLSCTVDYVLGLELVRNCDGSLTVFDRSLYRSGYSVPTRTVTLNGAASVQIVPPDMSTVFAASQLAYGSATVTLSIGSCSISQTIFIDSLPTILSIDVPLNVCEQTPVLFSATTHGSGLSYYWDFGDTSYNYGNNIYHSYCVHNAPYSITLIVTDGNGCRDTVTHTITVHANNLLNTNLLPTSSNPVCPGDAREIRCQSLSMQPNNHFTWYGNGNYLGNTIGIPSYYVYYTGDYRVHVLDNTYGCRAEAMCNVGFLNAPTARITGRSEYCYGEEVALSGFSGSQNSYLWTLNDPDIATFTDGNIRFLPTQSGSFLATLSVTNSAPCTATASYAYTVHPQIQPPHISLYGNQCIHQPPVNVRSDTSISLLWSNGFFGDTALYYTPGYISAHYIDSISGCPSKNAFLFIPPAPDFKALLTGCYYRCDDFAFKIPVFGLYPFPGQNFHWYWYHGTVLNSSGTQTSPELLIDGFGNYHMEASYGNGCSVNSPSLDIVEEEPCACNVKVEVKYECHVKECMPNYLFRIIIQNENPTTSNPINFSSLTVNSSSTLLSANVLPVVIPPGQTRTITAFVEFHDFENGFVSFTLTDTVNKCTFTFSKKVDWDDCINCECGMNIIGKTFNADLSNPPHTAWFDFTLLFPSNTTGLIDLWTEPSIVFNYMYVPMDTARGLLMLSYATLTQLAAEDGEICFHAIICLDNKRLCHAKFCMKAQGLLDLVPTGFKQMPASGDSGAPKKQVRPLQDGPYLVPNPARDEVTVMGIAPESVAEITVLTMDGRQTAVFRSDCRFDVSHITKAIYIVRVVTTDRKVYYLKLVKQ